MNVGLISTRLAGTDGVSLETAKMAEVLERAGHTCCYCAGELAPGLPGLEAPELHFQDPVAQELGQRAFGRSAYDASVVADIHIRARELERPLRAFLREGAIDYVVVQNAFAIPMQLPLAVALTHVLRDERLLGLAHNHDLHWERERFALHCLGDLLDRYFPPDLPSLRHATINSAAQRALRQRRGLDSILLPNVLDFDREPPGIHAYNADLRQAIGLSEGDWLILQPTRVVPRKGIELAIDLVARLEDPRAKLVITHAAGDEGLGYLQRLEREAQARRVDLRYVASVVGERRAEAEGRKVYALWDAYPHADLVTYPSLYEGFGNALLEAVYFRRPVLVNRYPVYVEDIAPHGFRFIEIEGAVSDEAVAAARAWLEEPETWREAVAHNYRLGAAHYSYDTLSERLLPLVGPSTGGRR